MTARALPASATLPTAKLTLRKNWGTRDDVKRVLYVERSNATVGCHFHSLYGPDWCGEVSLSELDAEGEDGRRVPRADLGAVVERLAAVVTGEWAD